MVGDIVQLNEGSIVPANSTVLFLGMNHCEIYGVVDGRSNSDSAGGDEVTELLVNARDVTRELRMKSIALYILNSTSDGSGNGGSTLPVGSEVELYCGFNVLE